MTRSIASTAVLLLAVSGSAAVAASPADRAGTTKKADLVVKIETSSLTGRSLAVSAKVTNKAGKASGKAAKKSSLVVLLSTDAVAGSGDTELGMLAVGKLKPKKSATVSGTFTVPTTVPAGTYYVAACADALGKVKEKKENNNCSTGSTVTVAAGTITVTYSSTAPGIGDLTGSATNGTCTPNPTTGGGVCTVTSGVGTVVLTPSSTGPTFGGTYGPGTSGPCDGTYNSSTKTMTFTAPTANKSCVAIYS